ncbi:MAG: DUF459 domain-containing protein [Ectothiorhodospiraceae bacterium]|nr:DUF459 domain-containing protein [Chromatiales bacterium]MCP5154796.1 DUF459 domain-containing protein [Ectothiorhodospiraceae bacterium]
MDRALITTGAVLAVAAITYLVSDGPARLRGPHAAASAPAAEAVAAAAVPAWRRWRVDDRRYEAGEHLPADARYRDTVLLVGDSLSIPVGRALVRDYRQRDADTRFVYVGMESSGLARPDFFDWEALLGAVVGDVRPQRVLIMLGTNDDKPLRDPAGTTHRFGSGSWAHEYQRRIGALIERARAGGGDTEVLWVGAPVMRSAALADAVRVVNETARTGCERLGCRFVDTASVLAGRDGGFVFSLPDAAGRPVAVRAKDGVHLQPQGAVRLARHVRAALEGDGGERRR